VSITGPPPSATEIVHRAAPVGGGGGGGHQRRLTIGGSTGSLKGEAVGDCARMEALEIRLKNYKKDAIGVAKDILGLCDENVASKLLQKCAITGQSSPVPFSS
jgi:hypothetical protein